jgi:hypothetical protein
MTGHDHTKIRNISYGDYSSNKNIITILRLCANYPYWTVIQTAGDGALQPRRSGSGNTEIRGIKYKYISPHDTSCSETQRKPPLSTLNDRKTICNLSFHLPKDIQDIYTIILNQHAFQHGFERRLCSCRQSTRLLGFRQRFTDSCVICSITR